MRAELSVSHLPLFIYIMYCFCQETFYIIPLFQHEMKIIQIATWAKVIRTPSVATLSDQANFQCNRLETFSVFPVVENLLNKKLLTVNFWLNLNRKGNLKCCDIMIQKQFRVLSPWRTTKCYSWGNVGQGTILETIHSSSMIPIKFPACFTSRPVILALLILHRQYKASL